MSQSAPKRAYRQAQALRLPEPSEAEQAISEQLVATICQRAGADGMGFSEFMHEALYAHRLGYYTAGKHKLGEGGDFITAPELGGVFGHCLATQVREVLLELGTGDVLEAGAGSGKLAADILLALEAQDCLPQRYRILELSDHLRAQQHETLEHRAPHLLDRVDWLTQLPEDFTGVIVANELLDALPIERFVIREPGPMSVTVHCQDGELVASERPADATTGERLSGLDLPIGYTSEIGWQAEAWVRSMGERIDRGVMLLVDYGFPRAEYYHPQRMTGTLNCHYRHHHHDNPLVLVGLQDITAHVDFTAMAEAGIDSGLELLGYTSQGAFLIASGLEQIMQTADPADSAQHLALTHEINKLTSTAEMGELFKVIALGKGINAPLTGFAFQDRRHRL